MGTKTSDLLGSIPSVSELLEKPPIRALADRWNRSVVASGVRSFLDELRSDFERRTADSLPSIRELAERAARYVLEQQQSSLRASINATGQLWGSPWSGTPVADVALEQTAALGRQFVREPEATGAPSFLAADTAAALCRQTGAQAATVVHSYAGALWLALAAIAEGREVVVSRAELGDVEPGCSLAQLVASAGTKLREIGTTNRAAIADYEAAVSSHTAAVWRLSPDGYRVVGATHSAELEELVGLARDRELTLCDALGAAPLVELPSLARPSARSARSSVALGADLVLVRGDGLVGGPACGILVGRRAVVRRIEEHPLFAAWQIGPRTAVALEATLKLYDDPASLEQSVPLFQLLAAPVDNLRNRAERMAPQLAQAEGIASAQAVAIDSSCGLAPPAIDNRPSFGVALWPSDGNVSTLAQRLAGAAQPVFGRSEDDRLVLDLRSVFARQDQELVAAIVGPQPSADESQSAGPTP